MRYILNIGLARNGKPNLGLIDVMRAIGNVSLVHVDHAVVLNSDTEPTVVVAVGVSADASDAGISVKDSVRVLACLLDQDCIAVFDTEGDVTGLYGPRSDAWGEFNPDYFLLPDGSRLSDKAAKPAAPKAGYQGHMADGSSVQKHSAGSCYPFVFYGKETDKGLKFGIITPYPENNVTLAHMTCAEACEKADLWAAKYREARAPVNSGSI